MIFARVVGNVVSTNKDEKLVGGGTISVLPEGLSLEVMKTGGVGGMFVSIANARFVQTQPVFDPVVLERLLAATRPLGVPVLVGLMPLVGERNAEFLAELLAPAILSRPWAALARM